MSTIQISIDDQITPFISQWLRENPRFISSLTKSIGWRVQSRIKRLVRSKKIQSRWKERIPYEIRKKLDAEAPEAWLGRLPQAIGYQYVKEQGAVLIGWTSRSAAMEGRIFEEGAEKPVTPFTRRFFGRRGVPLRWNTQTLHVPKRPMFEPAIKIVQPAIGGYVDKKVASYIDRGGFTKKISKRKYEVFG